MFGLRLFPVLRGWGLALVTLLVAGLVTAAAPPRPQAAPLTVATCPGQAATLIDLVNGVRTGAGLPAFEVNATLMAVAQAHSEYQASINQGTHTGPDGSRPYDRVKAAGYGEGRHIYVSENIAWGYNLTPQGALDMWLPSPPHYQTMTGPLYQDVGAGCARNGNRVYFTLVAAGVAGRAPRITPKPPPGGPTATPPPPTPTLPYEPVIPATPRPDGAVIHTVRRGQTLMMIAGSYRVPLEDLLRYNDLTETSLLRIGQQLIIVPPQITATPTATPTPRAGPSPTAQAGPQTLPEPTATASPTATGRAQPPGNQALAPPPSGSKPPWPLLAALAAGFGLAVAGYVWTRGVRPV